MDRARVALAGRIALMAGAVLTLAACAGGPARVGPGATIAKGPTAPVSGTMRPYQIKGRWYYPKQQPDYDEVGLASWYGDAFHGRPTSTGERFDMRLPSAAHKTLPLPSVVEVINLENDRRIQIRVNDRGPFVDGRIIDLSRAAAEELGFLNKGLAKVRVRYLGPAERTGFNAPILQASNTARAPLRPARTPPPVAPPAPTPPPVATWSGPPAAPGDVDWPTFDAPAAPASPAPYVPAAAPPAPLTAPASRWSVQAGAFSYLTNAQAAAERLSAAGPAQILPQHTRGRTLWRVVLGPWDEADAAARARLIAAQSGFADAMVIPAAF